MSTGRAIVCRICGASCRCKGASPDGICCGCHRHRGRARRGVATVQHRGALQPALQFQPSLEAAISQSNEAAE
jgi:hypothetical protein